MSIFRSNEERKTDEDAQRYPNVGQHRAEGRHDDGRTATTDRDYQPQHADGKR